MCIVSSRTTLTVMQMTGVGILLGFILISTQIDATHGRSIRTDDDYFTEPIIKRNTWWTKKSLDSLVTVPHSTNIQSSPRSDLEKTQLALEVYACYVERCVPSFVSCARESKTEDIFMACKMIHNVCISSCSNSDDSDDIRL